MIKASERPAALEQARQGDVQALGDLLDSFRPYVRAMVHALGGRDLGTWAEDSDVIQDAMLEASRSFPRFRGSTLGEFIAWLRRIVARTVQRALRDLNARKRDPAREQRLEDLAGRIAADESSPSSEASRHEQAARVAAALERLPQDMRQVLLGRHVEDLAYADLAQQMQRTPGALRVLHVRALARLHDLLQE